MIIFAIIILTSPAVLSFVFYSRFFYHVSTKKISKRLEKYGYVWAISSIVLSLLIIGGVI